MTTVVRYLGVLYMTVSSIMIRRSDHIISLYAKMKKLVSGKKFGFARGVRQSYLKAFGTNGSTLLKRWA